MIEALDKAIYDLLSGDATLAGMVAWMGPGYAPEDAEYPLLVWHGVGAPEVHNTLSRLGWIVYAHRFTAYTAQTAEGGPDRPTGQAIIARVIALLDRATLTVAGCTHLGSLIERPYAETVEAFGGKVYCGISVDLSTWLR